MPEKPPHSHLPSEVAVAIVTAIVLLCLFGVAAAVFLEDDPSTERVLIVFGFLAPTIAALAAFLRAGAIVRTLNGQVERSDEAAARSIEAAETVAEAKPLLDEIAERVRKGQM